MTVNELSQKAGLTPVIMPDGDRAVEGAYCGDLLSWVMGRAQSGDAWITIMSNLNVIAVASLSDVACVILAEGVALDEDAKKAAEEKEINILMSEKSAYQVAVMLGSLL